MSLEIWPSDQVCHMFNTSPAPVVDMFLISALTSASWRNGVGYEDWQRVVC